MTQPKEHPIQIEAVRVKDIYAFACRAIERVDARTILPISRQRALAWSKNPYADADDVVLYVAYHQGRCVGYQGVMPGRLRVGSTFRKVLWTSTLFVAPEFRQYQVALQLNKKALSTANDCFAIGPSPSAQTFLRLARWQPLRPAVVADVRLYAQRLFTMPVRLLTRALRNVRGCGPVCSAIDSVMDRLDRLTYPLEKSLYRGILMSSTRRLLAGMRWRVVSHFSAGDNVEAFVEEPEIGFHRGLEAINWMIEYPWIVERGQQPDDSRNYRFSNVRDVFRYIPVLLYRAQEGAPDGFAVFSVSRRHSRTNLKVLDFGPSHPDMCRRLAGLALKFATSWSADVVEMPTPVASALTDCFWARWLIRARELPCYGWPKDAATPLNRAVMHVSVGHCDGDSAFT